VASLLYQLFLQLIKEKRVCSAGPDGQWTAHSKVVTLDAVLTDELPKKRECSKIPTKNVVFISTFQHFFYKKDNQRAENLSLLCADSSAEIRVVQLPLFDITILLLALWLQ
jgi:hypothetical protein